MCCFKKSEFSRCGSVRFSGIVYPTVRFGAVLKNRESCCAVRCGSPRNVFFYGEVPNPRRENRTTNRFVFTVHRMTKKPYKTVVWYHSQAVSRGTHYIDAPTKPLQAAYERTVQTGGFVRFFCQVHIVQCLPRHDKYNSGRQHEFKKRFNEQ